MSLEPNSTFGIYRIGEVIGEGGMGKVYRATDTTLDREVAIKVLPDSFANDKDRVSRFEQEAKTLASLNHPNIGTIFGLERQGDTVAIVMELVEGPTLADKIAKGPLPPEEALRIARQIIDGLEAAHARGIVHRDLKPANIKIKDDGHVKLLDFGIAKPQEVIGSSGGGKTPTLITPAVTETGIIMGTAAYMSPEQARGRFVDQRTDIWAFGCVLYEMLTGQPAFGGEDVAETLARIITLEADTGSLTGVISPAVDKTIALCLQKDLKKRIADIRDVRLSLQGEFATYDVAAYETAAAGASGSRLIPAMGGIIAATLVLGGVGYSLWPEPESRLIDRFNYLVPENQLLRNVGRNVLAVSPDGRRFAYNTNMGIFLREMGELEAHVIPGTNESLTSPVFSPDGQWIAYFSASDAQLKKISISGGAPVVIGGPLTNPFGMNWAEDQNIYVAFSSNAGNAGTYRVSANGGQLEELIAGTNTTSAVSPELLPGGQILLYTRGPAPGSLATLDMESGEEKTLVPNGRDAHYLPSGHLIYAIDSDLFAVPFDLDTLSVTGGPIPVVQDVMTAGQTASVNYGVSNDGTLFYLNGSGNLSQNTLVWFDRSGREEKINAPPRNYQYAQISPDGTRIAVDARDENNDIWIFDIARETLQRLTLDTGLNRVPVWAPDGRLLFSRELEGVENVWIQAADGSGMAEQLTDERVVSFPNDMTPDGETLFYWRTAPTYDLFTVSVSDETHTGQPLLATDQANELNANLSPDGNWLAYQSDESGQYEVYVRPWPDIASSRTQVSRDGGSHPLWNRDGSELFFLDLDGAQGRGTLYEVSVDTTSGFSPGAPQKLFENNFVAPNQGWPAYDISPDGERFLMIKSFDQNLTADNNNAIIVVRNWIEELKRQTPVQ